MIKNIPVLFEDVVGQTAAKRQLSFYYEKSFLKNRVFPHSLFGGAKGNGKSLLAREIAKGLVMFDETGEVMLKEDGKTPKKRPFIEVNAASIKSPTQLVNSVLIPHLQDKDVTLFFDEAAEIPHKVAIALLSMLNPTSTGINTYTDVSSEYTIDIINTRHCFLFATTDVQKIFPPLVDRLTRFNLEDYTQNDLAEIIRRNLPEVNFEEGILEDVATTLRGNARQAVKRSKEIEACVTTRGNFGKKQWKELVQALAILPMGLNEVELSVLRILKECPEGSSLRSIGAKTGLSVDSVAKDFEIYLSKLSLMETCQGKGRMITSRGLDYLKRLDAVSVY